MKNLVIYHANCMDGLASAALWELAFPGENIFKAIQYGTPMYKNFLEELNHEQYQCNNLVLLDFSLPAETLKNCIPVFQKITVLDHHKTAQADLEQLKNVPEIDLYFDMTKCGAQITIEYINICSENDKITPQTREVINYIGDRDLWKFELPDSETINEGLRFNLSILKKDMSEIDAMQKLLVEYNTIASAFEAGKVLLQNTELSVSSAIKEDKLTTVNLSNGEKNIEVLMVNSPCNISEIGNKICLSYDKLACIYFVLPNGEVVFSLRSIDNLEDASVIAKYYGGGGHRNACGFKKDLAFLSNLYAESL